MSYEYLVRGEDVFADGTLESHPLADLLPMMDGEEYAGLLASVEAYGVVEPIILLDGKILDGRNRYRACCELGFGCPTRVVTDISPMNLVKMLNVDRRHLNKGQIAIFVQGLMDYSSGLGVQERSGNLVQNRDNVTGATEKSLSDFSGNTAERIAREVGVSPTTLKEARVVHKHGTEAQKRAVASGAVSVKKVAEEIRAQEKATSSKMNVANDKIGWAQYSWNPVVGCKYGCSYCYAREIHNHYFKSKHEFNDPHFYEDRIDMPANTKPRKADLNNRVFVGSMCDLFGDWVPAEWINRVLDACENNPHWTFLFLTKNPKRLTEFAFPLNAWVGATVDVQSRVASTAAAMAMVQAPVRFISVEPFLEALDLDGLVGYLDLVIVGALSHGATKEQPDTAWVESVLQQVRAAGKKIWFKENLVFRPQEAPNATNV